LRDWTTLTVGPQETRALGRRLGELARPGLVVLLSGDLGAGKTCFAQGVADGLGTPAGTPVTSPSYTLLNIHYGRLPLYHFDLYRLERAEDLEDLDYFGTLEADGVAVVEWGDRFSEALPRDGLVLALHIEGDEERRIELHALGDRGRELVAQLAQVAAGLSGVRLPGGGRS